MLFIENVSDGSADISREYHKICFLQDVPSVTLLSNSASSIILFRNDIK